MPPPPPPAPPPPPLLNVPKVTNERSKLLGDIQKGAKLKKTVTNDRSAPIVAGSKPSAAPNNTGMKPVTAASPAPSAGIGGLFANGMPKKPSDNKNKRFDASIVTPIKPASSVVPPPKPVNSMSVRQDTHTTHFPSSVSSEPRTTNVHPPPPPPPMPQLKQKAPPPEAPSAASKPIQSQKFSTIRPLPPANKPQQLRRTGSTEDTHALAPSRPVARPAAPPPPPPTRPPIHSTPSVDDNEPPPPPPPPRLASVATPSSGRSAVNLQNPTSPPVLPSNSSPYLNAGGNGFMKTYEERFQFLDISELPPPEAFKNFPKYYDQQKPST